MSDGGGPWTVRTIVYPFQTPSSRLHYEIWIIGRCLETFLIRRNRIAHTYFPPHHGEEFIKLIQRNELLMYGLQTN